MLKIMRIMFSRVVLFGAAILIQALVLVGIIWKFSNYFVFFYAFFTILSSLAVLGIINGRSNPAYKIAWIVPIMVFPIFGGLFYLMFGGLRPNRKSRLKLHSIVPKMKQVLSQDPEVMEQLQQEGEVAANQSRYLEKYSNCPVYNHTITEYLSPGERKFERLVAELKKAKRYIFLEYFIIEEGTMWNTILDILVEKVREGVDVRVIYDDVGCLLTLPFGYDKYLESLGIKCRIFNPFSPLLTVRQNTRDHRKIAVIDGHIGFTGGINLADEYINAYEKHGHWKDASVVLQGDGVWSLAVMFLSLWEWLNDINEDYEQFRPLPEIVRKFTADGYVQPFADNPLDDEAIGESVYLNLIGNAKRYVYINTPYLILDNEMNTALCLAAKRGVEVRIVTPHIADKWFVHAVTRSYYEELVSAGVLIYEYTPGFIHAKTFVVDDEFAVVGTINLDYRSLYLHFECGVWLYQTRSIAEVKEDYLRTLQVCQEITLETCRNIKWYKKLCWSFLRMFAPLM